MTRQRALDVLIAEAFRHPVQGWDFRWLREQGRFEEGTLPWDYNELVRARTASSPDLLDLGTGGGERLAGLAPHPVLTVATESYAPAVPFAGRKLRPLGVQVVRVSQVPENTGQRVGEPVPPLPFRDESFHLVIDRNDAYVPAEVARVLSERGTFLTEQSGTAEIPALQDLLGLPVLPETGPAWGLGLASEQLAAAGLSVTGSGAADFHMVFHDVGALAWYLRMVPWAAPGFPPDRHWHGWGELHSRLRQGELRIPRHAFWISAIKPGPSSALV